jgi:DNA polymerase elongation subunit (family B)
MSDKFQQFVVEEISSDEYEYVYDLEMSDCEQPWFYGNGILVHNSIYLSLKPLIHTGVISSVTNNDGLVSKDVYSMCVKLEDHLNKEIKEWAVRSFNTIDCRLLFKREAISDVGIFLEKKRYALHILDDEGFAVDKFKYTGVEVVRTTMPVPVKPHVKKIIETMMTTKSQSITDKVVREAYDIFTSLPVEDVAFVVGLSTFAEYIPKCKGFTTVKGMPVHAKAGYYYNLILKDLNVDNIYESAQAGDKIRWMYVKKSNKYGIEVIGFKNTFPEEFKSLFEVDYDKMFNKIVFSVVERFYNCVDWIPRLPNNQIKTDLFDLFG